MGIYGSLNKFLQYFGGFLIILFGGFLIINGQATMQEHMGSCCNQLGRYTADLGRMLELYKRSPEGFRECRLQ